MIRLLQNSSKLSQIHRFRQSLSLIPKRATTNDPKPDKTEKLQAPLDGAEACANAAYALSECAFIYPITPSTTMSEYFDEQSVKGRKSVIGEMPVAVHEMQSEAGAVGAMHGASVSGSLATTFTASQGLLLMIPNLYQFSGELLPAVFHVAARSITKQALSIFGDHQDVMAVRQTGVALLCSNDPQEAQDLAIISHVATLKSRIPFLHFQDGWRTTSTVHKIDLFSDEQIKKIYPYDALENNLRNTGINLDNANMRGTAQGPDIYFQALVANHKYYLACPDLVQETMNDFAKIFGREYNLFDYYGSPTAERCIIMMGSGCCTVEQTVDEMNKRNENVGLVKVRLFRPWSAQHFLDKLPATIKKIAVLDRTREDGAQAQPLHLDIAMSLTNSNRNVDVITGGQYGISSKEFKPSMVRAVYGNLNKSANEGRMANYIVGIDDDVTNTSLPYDEYELDKLGIQSSLPTSLTQCMFWGMGGDGTVGANKQSIKDVADNTDLFVQAYFAYTAHKSGGVTVSHLRFGPEPIKAEYEVQEADYISVHNSMWIQKFVQIVDKAKFGSTLVLNSTWNTVADIEKFIPEKIRKIMAIKNMSLYNIDASAVAKSVGLGQRINLVMQSVFYKLSGILPEEEALDIMRNSIKKVYHDKGPDVIDMNIQAVNKGLAGLIKIDYPQNEWISNIKIDDNININDYNRDYSSSTPQFVKDVLYSMSDMTANELPVSAFTAAGIVPSGTSKYERRAISTTFPAWNADKCTQCNYCSLVCPHAVIRPFLLNRDELSSAPSGYLSKKTKPSLANTNYSIQIAPMDCTGCEVCVLQCPDDALSMVSYEENIDKQLLDWEYSVNNISSKIDLLNKDKTEQTNRLSVKGSQFYEPLCEFHGACAGCGESPYLKLITQMFGKNVVIANATGCSSIWGASAPNNPYSVNWANSLFEDNAEFGFGITEASTQRRKKLFTKLSTNDYSSYGTEINDAVKHWVDTYDDIGSNNLASDSLLNLLSSDKQLIFNILGSDKNMLKKSINWIVGGDGWAYDIGFGGLDHVFAQGSNVNILVLDTEMYSNTGGQASKSTPTSASVKFAAGGMGNHKKDLGQIAMLYKNIYVSSIAMGADYEQTCTAIREAQEYNGTSVLIALAPCIDWGFPMKEMMQNQKLAVDTGYWPLYRYDPRKVSDKKNPFQLDSKRIREDLQKYLKQQNRFGKLERANPKQAERLQTKLSNFSTERHEQMFKSSLDDDAYFDYLYTKLGKTDSSKDLSPKTLVLYGSETGNARILSDIILHEFKRRDVSNLSCVSMDDYDFNDLLDMDDTSDEINLIFSISTCGQGELPKNCQYFMKELLESTLKQKKLSSKINYAVFGLGDSSYVYFNEAAKILDNGLNELGANRLIDCGMGDDGDEDGYDQAFEEWIPAVYDKLEMGPPSSELMDCIYNTDIFQDTKNEFTDLPPFIPNDCIEQAIPLITNKRLTPNDYDRDFRHYEFDIKSIRDELEFDVGDCLGISPVNQFEYVNKLCDLYNINHNSSTKNLIKIDKVDNNNSKTQIIDIFDLFSRKLDICGKPKRRFYELLSMVATDDNDKKYLNYLLSNEGNQEFKSLKLNDTPNYVDLLLKFQSAKPDINYLIEYIPELKQRLYSIANSPKMYPNQIDLFIVKDDWYTQTDNIYKEGICTKYLENLQGNQDNVYGKIHGASVTVADNHSAPIVLTGLGSGLAPLRAHVQDRVYAKSAGETVGPVALIFGSRNAKNEYFYQDEFEDYHQNGKGVLTHLLPAFSRDQDKKYYVTNRIEEEGKMIYDYLVNKNGYFYYCGQGGSVPENIKKEVTNSFIKHGNMTKEQAEQTVIDMQLSGRYNVEAW